jgi:trehalose-6-phosphatase
MVRVVNIGLNHEIAPTGYKVSWSTNSLFGMFQLVFDYFCERTPRSYVESRETSLVWNYKYAGKDLAQLLLGCKKNLQEEG